MKLVELKDVWKFYGDRPALKGINFEVQIGRIVGLLGPNGAGKTTAMRIITGYMPPTKGEVRVCGFDVVLNPIDVKKKIGYLPESPPLYSEMKVVDYLKFVGRLKGLKGKKLMERIDFVLERCGLKDVKGRIIGNLSKGYRQRVGLAQAIIHEPEVVIFDEPTSALDPQQVVEVRDLIREISSNTTVILSTHILSEVTKLCTDVVIISRGRIVFSADLNNLNVSERRFVVEVGGDKRRAKEVLSRIGRIEEKNGVFIMRTSKDVREEISISLYENKIPILSLYEEKPSVEEIYLQVISSEGEE